MIDATQAPEGQVSEATQAATTPDTGARMNDQVRQLIMQIGQLAQQNPEAQQEFAVAAKALTAASVKLVSGQPAQSPSQPVIGA